MNSVIGSELYRQDVEYVKGLPLQWERLENSSFVISGATGMIGSFLIDVLMSKFPTGIKIFALGRNAEKARERFGDLLDDDRLEFVSCDINKALDDSALGDVQADYMFHFASNTHPMAYSTNPIGTVTANIIGTNNLLEYGASHGNKRFIFASSVEVYGENRGDTEKFSEDYLGYIDCNTLRAGYPESKRAGEALCQAYISQKDMDVVIARLSRTYGPTLLKTDTKALSQFINKGVSGEDIVLKSEGNQLYSYSYVADSVAGVFYCLLAGEKGEAYNVSDAASDITLKELSQIIADYVGTKVVFELPDAAEARGYSTATKALLDPAKINALGYKAGYDIKKGLQRTIDMLKA
ncbi:MAG: NAD-dependent epimerase/dehydratase family protein [Eubacterium sp.]|nr:NAD-dependent epimerase/dehydratase family protein [Eubacterium sp.]